MRALLLILPALALAAPAGASVAGCLERDLPDGLAAEMEANADQFAPSVWLAGRASPEARGAVRKAVFACEPEAGWDGALESAVSYFVTGKLMTAMRAEWPGGPGDADALHAAIVAADHAALTRVFAQELQGLPPGQRQRPDQADLDYLEQVIDNSGVQVTPENTEKVRLFIKLAVTRAQALEELD